MHKVAFIGLNVSFGVKSGVFEQFSKAPNVGYVHGCVEVRVGRSQTTVGTWCPIGGHDPEFSLFGVGTEILRAAAAAATMRLRRKLENELSTSTPSAALALAAYVIGELVVKDLRACVAAV